jgi:hypothetical protein
MPKGAIFCTPWSDQLVSGGVVLSSPEHRPVGYSRHQDIALFAKKRPEKGCGVHPPFWSASSFGSLAPEFPATLRSPE